jgi:hypothetical protein
VSLCRENRKRGEILEIDQNSLRLIFTDFDFIPMAVTMPLEARDPETKFRENRATPDPTCHRPVAACCAAL